VRISGSNAGYTVFRGSVKSTGYHTPFASFPFTSPPMHHRVPSRFNWTLQMDGISGYFGRCQERNVGNYNKLQAICDKRDTLSVTLFVCLFFQVQE
jgi:hypothetical protein